MTTHKNRTVARQFAAIMERAGASVDVCEAGTGTVYVTVEQWFKVRFADHGKCYCREHISVDPDGCTLEQAVRAAGRECELYVTRSLAGFKAAASRAAAAREADRIADAPILARCQAEQEAKDAFQRTYIAARYPDYADQPKKVRKRIRAKANAAFRSQHTAV